MSVCAAWIHGRRLLPFWSACRPRVCCSNDVFGLLCSFAWRQACRLCLPASHPAVCPFVCCVGVFREAGAQGLQVSGAAVAAAVAHRRQRHRTRQCLGRQVHRVSDTDRGACVRVCVCVRACGACVRACTRMCPGVIMHEYGRCAGGLSLCGWVGVVVVVVVVAVDAVASHHRR